MLPALAKAGGSRRW